MDSFFTTTGSGTRLLHINYYTYRRRREIGLKEYWSCERHCGVTCITEDSNVVSLNGEHSHETDRQKVNRLKAIDKMKAKLAENSCSLRMAYDAVLTERRRGSAEEKATAGNIVL